VLGLPVVLLMRVEGCWVYAIFYCLLVNKLTGVEAAPVCGAVEVLVLALNKFPEVGVVPVADVVVGFAAVCNGLLNNPVCGAVAVVAV